MIAPARVARVAGSCVLIAIVGSGCTSRGSPARADSQRADSQSADSAASFSVSTERTSREIRLDSLATLVDVRSSPHRVAYERVVFDFADAVPGYTIEYTADPAACGSGKPVDAGGDASLAVRLEPAQAHRTVGDDVTSTITREQELGTAAVQRLVLSCDFEGVVSWVIGLDRRRPYRAFTLDQPPRLVVDIATTDTAAAPASARQAPR